MNTVQHNITVTKNILEILISRNSALQFFIITEYRHTHIWAQMTADTSSFSTAAFFSSSFEEKSIITDLFIFNDCRIVIKLTDTVLIDYWCILSSVTLYNCINSHIHITADQNIIAIKIVTVKQLKSDDLTVYTFTVTEKKSLQSNIR